MDADRKGLLAMSGIGHATADALIEIGIPTPQALRDVGAVDAYRRLRFALGARVKAPCLIALDCAVTDTYWRDVTQERIGELGRVAWAINAELNGLTD